MQTDGLHQKICVKGTRIILADGEMQDKYAGRNLCCRKDFAGVKVPGDLLRP